jgi:hypothetical protein
MRRGVEVLEQLKCSLMFPVANRLRALRMAARTNAVSRCAASALTRRLRSQRPGVVGTSARACEIFRIASIAS